MRLIYLSLSWLLGIYLGSRAALPWSALVVALVAISVLIILVRPRRTLLVVGICLVAFFGGILRFQSTAPTVDEHALQFYNDEGPVEIEGLVAADPEPQDRTTALRLEARKMRGKGESEWGEVSGTALVYASKFPFSFGERDFPYYRYGDLIKVEGRLETPPELEDFNWREYLARQGIGSVILRPEGVALVASGQGFKPLEWVYSLRNNMSQALDSALPEPQGALAQGILLGRRSTIPSELNESFSRAGTMHIIAISGLNVAIVAGMLLSLGVWLFGRRRPTYILLPFGTIWLYVTLSGMQPSAVRAAIMGSLWLLADATGRQRSAFTALLFAAALMVGIQPLMLWDVSFQLSFAAMAGLAFLPQWAFLRKRALLGTPVIYGLLVTLAAISFTWPLVAFYFHRISLVGLPATFLALPALPGAIVASALVGGVGLLTLPLAQLLGWVDWLLLGYMIWVTELFSSLPFTTPEVEIGAPLVWSYYLALAAALWLSNRWRRIPAVADRLTAAARLLIRLPARWLIWPLLVMALLVWIAAIALPDNRLHVFFLDVGQGDAILIQKGSQQVLIDGGPSPEEISLELGAKLPFWDRTIEMVVLTHPEADHIAGLLEVLRRYRVEQVLTGGQGHESSIYVQWLSLIAEKGVERTIARAGQRIELGQGARLEVLHPQATLLQGTAFDINNNSVVLRLVLGDASFLLSGDISREGERYLLQGGAGLRSTVLKVAHHGSNTSTSPDFLAAVDPQLAVVSVGADNTFGHPSDEVLGRLSGVQIYRTDKQGTIELITDGEKLWLRTER